MKFVYRVDEEGYFKEPVRLNEGDVIPSDCVEDAPMDGLYRPRRVNKLWVHGLTDEEIEAEKNQPTAPTEAQKVQQQILDLYFELALKGVL